MTEIPFAILPEEAFLDEHITLGALRVLRLVWSMCLREGRIAWSDYLTSAEMAKAAGVSRTHLYAILRELTHLDYIIVGPSPATSVYILRPHQRFGETAPSRREMGKLFRTVGPPTTQGSLESQNEGKPGTKPVQSCRPADIATTDSLYQSVNKKSSSSRSKNLRRKSSRTVGGPTQGNSFSWTPLQQAILDLLAENGMEGAVPMQVALRNGMTFRRAILLVHDGLAKDQGTGIILTRLRGRDLPPKVCPLCEAKKGFHYGFTDGDREMNCPVSDDPDMTDEALAAAWRRIQGMKIQVYWMGQEIEE